MDEAWINTYIYRERAKWLRWERVYWRISGRRYSRKSIIAWRNFRNKLIATMVFDWTANTDLVVNWVKDMLLPSLEPSSIIIFDNASFHKSIKIREIIESNWHILLFLPPYSPDLNPIEHKWNELKQRLRKSFDTSLSFVENLISKLNDMSELIMV